MGTLIVVLLAILIVLAILSVALTVVERRRRGPKHDPALRADRGPSSSSPDRPGRFRRARGPRARPPSS